MKKHTVRFEDGNKYELVLEYGFVNEFGKNRFVVIPKLGLNSKVPRETECGDYIHKYMPELEYLMKWHYFTLKGPNYYYDDAIFYWKSYKRNDFEDCFDITYFKKHVVYGTSKLDNLDFDRDYSEEELTEWLRARLPEVVEAFRRDMERAGLM